jgi:hypothetical protein
MRLTGNLSTLLFRTDLSHGGKICHPARGLARHPEQLKRRQASCGPQGIVGFLPSRGRRKSA